MTPFIFRTLFFPEIVKRCPIGCDQLTLRCNVRLSLFDGSFGDSLLRSLLALLRRGITVNASAPNSITFNFYRNWIWDWDAAIVFHRRRSPVIVFHRRRSPVIVFRRRRSPVILFWIILAPAVELGSTTTRARRIIFRLGRDRIDIVVFTLPPVFIKEPLAIRILPVAEHRAKTCVRRHQECLFPRVFELIHRCFHRPFEFAFETFDLIVEAFTHQRVLVRERRGYVRDGFVIFRAVHDIYGRRSPLDSV